MADQAEQIKKMNEVIEFTANGEKVALSFNTVRNYLVSGNPEKVTWQEVQMFINLCRYNGLNPWLKEAYCIKYGNSPATMVVSKEAYMKRAEANPNFDGFEAGIIVKGAGGKLEYRKGTFYEQGEQLIGGYAEVWRKDRSHSIRAEIAMNEYVGRKSDGTVNGQWSTKPATMVRKVALVQALREAFPTDIGGIYTEEEQEESPVSEVKAEVVSDPFALKEEKKETKPVENVVDVQVVDADEMPFA